MCKWKVKKFNEFYWLNLLWWNCKSVKCTVQTMKREYWNFLVRLLEVYIATKGIVHRWIDSYHPGESILLNIFWLNELKFRNCCFIVSFLDWCVLTQLKETRNGPKCESFDLILNVIRSIILDTEFNIWEKLVKFTLSFK